MAMKASSSMKLLKRRKMRKKTQKKPTKLTSLKKKKAKNAHEEAKGNMINPLHRRRKYNKSKFEFKPMVN